MDKLAAVAIILGLVLLNGLFVAAEFAIVGVPRVSMERRAAAGDRMARRVLGILRDRRRRDRYIATAQLGITMASLGLGMYGEHVLAGWIGGALDGRIPEWRWITAHAIASVLAVAVLTYFHIVLGEMVPKSVALQQPERTVTWVTHPIVWLQTVAFVVIVALNWLGNGVLRLFGINRGAGGSEQYRTPEELRYIVRESQAGGMLRRESAEVVQELLDFGDLTAGEVMVPRVRVVGIPVGATFAEASEIIRGSPHTRYPIYRGSLDDIVGMVHIKDLFRRLRNRRAVHEADARAVPYIPETATIDRVLAAMRESRTQMAVVMDEHGGTAGILTVEDLFEEVVGEIEESSVHRPEVSRDPEGRLRVDGTVRIEEVGEELGMVLEHDEVDSVSGLVLALLGRPPELDDVVEYQGVRFQVTRVEGHGVGECLVIPPEKRRRGDDDEEEGNEDEE
jgi:CBS domain containing-hemolysin-like protein